MGSKVIKKMNDKLKFLHRLSRFVTSAYKRLLCNALIQSDFVPGYMHEIFKQSLYKYRTRSQMALDLPLLKKIPDKKAYPS